FPTLILVSVLSGLGPVPVRAQGVPDPDTAKAVVRCQKAITKAERTFAAAAFANLKKCIDAVFACVQLKPGDPGCQPKGTTTCGKQIFKNDQAAAKLRDAVRKACGDTPYDVLRSAAALDVDALAPTCLALSIGTLNSLDSYVECVFRIATCRTSDLVEAGA